MLVGTRRSRSRAARRGDEKAGYRDRFHPARLRCISSTRGRSDKPSKLFAVLNARFHDRKPISRRSGRARRHHRRDQHGAAAPTFNSAAMSKMRVAQECADLPQGPEHEAKEAESEPKSSNSGPRRCRRRPLYHRHRTPRKPPDRQSAARPCRRQGDPGRSKFFLSLKDDLMRIFAPNRMESMLVKLGLQEDEAIVHP